MGETNAFFYERPSKFFLVKNLFCRKKIFLGVKNGFVTKIVSLGIIPINFIPKKLKIVEICTFKGDVKLDFCDFCDFLFVFKN